MIEINLQKLQRGLRQVTRPIQGKTKVFQRKMWVGRRDKPKDKNPHRSEMVIAEQKCQQFTKELYDKYGFDRADSDMTLGETVKRKNLAADFDKKKKLFEEYEKSWETSW